MSAFKIAIQLDKLGIVLSPPPKAVGAYVTVIRMGNLVVTAGQLPWKDGKLAYTGKRASDLTVEQGYEAARVFNSIPKCSMARPSY